MTARPNPSLATVICTGRLTAAEAIQRARQMQIDHPDVLYLPQAYRDIIDGLMAAIDSDPAFAKAVERGQETFCLVQQDKLAPALIARWALGAKIHRASWQKVARAMRKATVWATFPGRKFPD